MLMCKLYSNYFAGTTWKIVIFLLEELSLLFVVVMVSPLIKAFSAL